jgi:oligopeptidase B
MICSPFHPMMMARSDSPYKIKRLSTGEILADRIENTIGSPVWSQDNRTLLYLEVNDQWRPFQVRSHQLGADPINDPILYEEEDNSFFVGLDRTRSRAYLLITTGDHVTNETRVLPATDPSAAPALIAPRETEHEYHVAHAGDLSLSPDERHA